MRSVLHNASLTKNIEGAQNCSELIRFRVRLAHKADGSTVQCTVRSAGGWMQHAAKSKEKVACRSLDGRIPTPGGDLYLPEM